MMAPNPWIIVVAVMASLLEIIDVSIVNVALPTMMGNLGATLEDISMIITGYAIANAIVLPVSAWLSEKVGRRKYFLGCILAFTFSSVACGLAPNLETLIVFRIIQGLMGGALLPTSQALIYEQFPREKAGIAGAIFGMSVMIGPTLGPVMGGYLTDEFGWRSIFNINLPLGLLAFFIGTTCIFNRTKSAEELSRSTGFDALGLTFLVLGVGCLQYVLERGETLDWLSSPYICTNIIVSAICLPLFVWWELRIPNPIINIRLFKQGIVANGVGLMTMLGFFLYSIMFLLPVFLGLNYHYTATQIGIFFIPGSILTAMMMPFIGNAMSKGTNPKILIFVGLCCIELCLYLMTFFSPLTSQNAILTILFVRGFALAFMFVPINSSILSSFQGANVGQVSGLLNLSRQIGGSAGIAFVATFLGKFGHQNFVDLTSHISLIEPATQSFYYGMAKNFSSKMTQAVGMVSLNRTTLVVLQHKIQAQVFMLSFIQLIWTIMIIFALAFLPLALIKLKRGAVKPVDAH